MTPHILDLLKTIPSSLPSQWLLIWACCTARVAGLLAMAPIFQSPVVPWRFRLLLAGLCGMVVAPQFVQAIDVAPDLWVIAGRAVIELLLGVGIGLGIQGLISALQAAGGWIDQQAGTAMSELLSPSGSPASPMGVLLTSFGFLWLLSLPGGEARILNAVLHSFHTIPVGRTHDLSLFAPTVLAMTGESLRLTIQFAAPVLAVASLLTLGFGFLSRGFPTLPVVQMSLPVRCAACLGVVFVSLSHLGEALTGALETLLDTGAMR